MYWQLISFRFTDFLLKNCAYNTMEESFIITESVVQAIKQEGAMKKLIGLILQRKI